MKIIDLTGKKFGKLTVLERAEDKISVSKSGKQTKQVQWLCQCECGNTIIMPRTKLVSNNNVSCGCEVSDWVKLCEYVKSEIMNYKPNQVLSKLEILRLKGLSVGKGLLQEKGIEQRNYSFEIILNTFKYCKEKILNSFKKKNFDNELNKFYYACAIVENNLNDVFIKLEKNKKQKEEIERVSHIVYGNYNPNNYVASKPKNSEALMQQFREEDKKREEERNRVYSADDLDWLDDEQDETLAMEYIKKINGEFDSTGKKSNKDDEDLSWLDDIDG